MESNHTYTKLKRTLKITDNMKPITFTKKENRFLAVWVAVCTFALLCNIIPIRGEVRKNVYLFSSAYQNPSEYFWPFSDFVYDEFMGRYDGENIYRTHFCGIFNSFDYKEFIIYIMLVLIIMVIRKIW